MKHLVLSVMALATGLGSHLASPSVEPVQEKSGLELGNFSVSLTVKDLKASRAFYEKLGFSKKGGAEAQRYLILQNGTTTIGLFQGMFERNLLTFNPGWTKDAKPLKSFTDVRDIQKKLVSQGIKPVTRADESSTGPASFVVVDPDGNPIMFDQHLPRPKSGM